MPNRKRSNVPIYVRIAETFTRQVATGGLRPGDRVPSLRKLSREQGVSLSTALQAYVWLENRGYLEARPQSGFYIRTPFAKLIPEPQAESLQSQPAAMGTNAVSSNARSTSAGNPITGDGLPNPAPIVTRNWGQLPVGRKWGTTAGI